MGLTNIVSYYSREDIQQAILDSAKNREVAGVFAGGSFSGRPNTITYAQDITSMVKQGVREFHCSLEHWSRPMALRRDNYDELRTGWDLILDIDCKAFEHSKIATAIVVKALKDHDMKNISVKYTGGKGFHIGIPWSSIPESVNFKQTVNQFPALPRIVGDYVRQYAENGLKESLLKHAGNDPIQLANEAGLDISKIAGKMKRTIKDPYKFVVTGKKISSQKTVIDTDEIDVSTIANIRPISDVDSVLLSPRHLYRMPYSLHKTSLLASIPIRPEDISDFTKDQARPEKVKPNRLFLNTGEPGEAGALIAEAMDWYNRREPEKKKSAHAPNQFEKGIVVKKEDFPPCIKNILKGVSDGRKRSIFILTNFLTTVGWGSEAIEDILIKWNSKNTRPLPESQIMAHVRWHKSRIRSGLPRMPPPGCTKEGYYTSFEVCTPDSLCGGERKTIKNPVNYSLRKNDSKTKEAKSRGVRDTNKKQKKKQTGSALTVRDRRKKDANS